MTTRRRTRNSAFDDIIEPPQIRRSIVMRKGLSHAEAIFVGRGVQWWCCRRDLDLDINTTPGTAVTCLKCALCKGCPACRDNFITEHSLYMGKWETHDKRRLYPFEMDNQHLMNAIAKLKRDRERFKRHWVDWLSVMEDEARNRGLS